MLTHSHNQNVTVVLGAQWGDEGKGKWVDILAEQSDLVARYQGGNNAGHTLYIDGKKVVLHQIPSGIFHKRPICAMAAGVVLNPVALVQELKGAHERQVPLKNRLFISSRAHVITPWHQYIDQLREGSGSVPIGTTKKGIGPTYSDKASRTGLRVGTFIHPEELKKWFKQQSADNPDFAKHLETHKAEWDVFSQSVATIREFVSDVESKIRDYSANGKAVLLEGAQGTLLDLDHGTYPFVTSSSTTSSGACSSIGLSPRYIAQIVGVAKAYVTRVGAGYFPSELFDDVGQTIAKKGNEFGATTGRPRRCGWLDLVALKYACQVNGMTGLIINKADILSDMGTVKLCTGYQHKKLGALREFPAEHFILEECQPIYKELQAWTDKELRSGAKELKAFIAEIEEFCEVPVLYVGTGTGRDDFIKREFFAK